MIDTQNDLKEILIYNPETGVFTWTYDRGKFKQGSIAGTINEWGYLIINIDKKLYRGHRLAWLYMTGKWPEFDIDHEDTNKANNRWLNLRPANKSKNGANRDKPKNNKSGTKGVYWDNGTQKWRAKIGVNNKHICLGRYIDIKDAQKAYAEAAIKYFGEYSRIDQNDPAT